MIKYVGAYLFSQLWPKENGWQDSIRRRQLTSAELAEFTKSEHPYALVAIDIFSKKLAVERLRSKTSAETTRALPLVLTSLRVPNVVMTDNGGEFRGQFRERVESYYDAEHLTTRTGGIFVERVIRTLRDGIRKRLLSLNLPKSDWWKVVDFVVSKYNDTTHQSTAMKPNRAARLNPLSDGDQIRAVRNNITAGARKGPHGEQPRRYPPLRVGDQVRLISKPGKYSEYKEGFVAWSEDLFRVERLVRTGGVVRYKLEGKNEPVLRHELLKITGARAPNLRGARQQVEARARTLPLFEAVDGKLFVRTPQNPEPVRRPLFVQDLFC